MRQELRDIPYPALFEMTPASVLVLTPDLVVVEATKAYLDAVGRDRAEVVGRYIFDLFPVPPDPDGYGMANVLASLERARDTGRPDTMAIQRYDIPARAGGFERRYWSPIHVPIVDADGRTVLLLHRAEDVTEFVHERQLRQGERQEGQAWRRRMEEAEIDLFARARELQELNSELRDARDALATQVLREPLTGLLIRPVLMEYVSRALAGLSRSGGRIAVLFIDLDGLKQVNDSYGHAAGDALLRCFATHLRETVRTDDPIARVGGDEFVVLLEHLHDTAQAAAVAGRLLEALDSCRATVGLPPGPTASIGITVADSDDVGADALISRADSAMYRAKRAGGSRYALDDGASYSEARAPHVVRAELAAAVRDDQLRLHFQAITDLTSGATDAVEALVRWQHPQRGLLAAAEFIDIAEEGGVVLSLGRWVVTEACRQLAEWDALLRDRAPAQVFLNISVPELAHPGLPDHLARAAAEVGIDPQRLVLEIAETGILHGPHALTRAVDPLVELGCPLAIDDFGTGHSSLTRLVEVPASIVKIDRSFIHDVARGGTPEVIVRSVVLLAHSLDLSVVAEGVEDAETLSVLHALGCDYAQGYHVARPEPADAVTVRLGGDRAPRSDQPPGRRLASGPAHSRPRSTPR